MTPKKVDSRKEVGKQGALDDVKENLVVNVNFPCKQKGVQMDVSPEILNMENKLRKCLRNLLKDLDPDEEVTIGFELDVKDSSRQDIKLR